MRSRTLTKMLDKIFWFIVLLLPLIVYIVGSISIGMVRDYQFADQNLPSLFSILTDYFGYDGNGIIFQICELLTFGLDYILGDFSLNQTLCGYITYMLQVEFLHLFIDILLFIFKYARNLMDKWGCVDG